MAECGIDGERQRHLTPSHKGAKNGGILPRRPCAALARLPWQADPSAISPCYRRARWAAFPAAWPVGAAACLSMAVMGGGVPGNLLAYMPDRGIMGL